MTISPLTDQQKAVFGKLFQDYYDELECFEGIEHLLEEFIYPDWQAGLFCIDLLADKGFVIYQIDTPENEYCQKEGWGTVRELYVVEQERGKGYGTQLLQHALQQLAGKGAKQIYTLPCEGCEYFFEKGGFAPTEEYNEESESFFYTQEVTK